VVELEASSEYWPYSKGVSWGVMHLGLNFRETPAYLFEGSRLEHPEVAIAEI
jgi:hypothetical protein